MTEFTTTATATPAPDESPLLSRTGIVGPYGPLVSEFKTRVDLELELMVRRACAEAGTDVASLLRNWLNQAFRQGVSYDEACLHEAKRRSVKFGLQGPIQSLSRDEQGARA